MENVSILMATYNGEKYLSELLDSIIEQTYSNWELIVRDDESTDNTRNILEEYSNRDKRIRITYGKKRLGAKENFNQLLKTKDLKEHVMFCDQDDIWLQDKIDHTLKKMKEQEHKYGKETPQIVFCKKQVVNSKLEEINKGKKGIVPDCSLWEVLIRNPVYGCTMMINKSLRTLAGNIPDYVQTHDYYFALYAACYGKITYLDEALILYRQHEGNVTGGENNYGFIKKIHMLTKVNKRIHETIKQNYMFCCSNGNCNQKEISAYREMIEKRPFQRIIYAKKTNYKTKGRLSTLRLFLALFTYK